jgi:hypothetical protein
VLRSADLDVAEVLGHGEGLQQIRVVADDLDGLIELGAGQERRCGADLRGGECAEFVAVVEEGLMELLEAPDPQLDIGRPRTVVEGATRGRTSPVAGFEEAKVRSVSTSLPSISMCRSAFDRGACALDSACPSVEIVGVWPIILLSVMEISFSSPANHTFAR